MASADVEVFLWLNQWVGHFPLLDSVVKAVVSDYLIPVLFSLTLLGLWFCGRKEGERDRHQRSVIVAMLGIGIGNLVVAIINQQYFRLRPFNDHDVSLLFYQPTDSSFPANPAVVAFAIAAGVWGANRWVGGVLYVLAFLYGLSRVYAGVFYPLDVVAGALIGVTSTYLMSKIFRLVEPLSTFMLKLARLFYLA